MPQPSWLHSSRVKRYVGAAILSSPMLIGFLAIRLATPQGIGITWDSVGYIGSATNLLDGHGLTMAHWIPPKPMTHWAPFYSILLCIPTILGAKITDGAWHVSVLAFGATACVITELTRRYLPQPRMATPIAALLFLSSPDMIFVHSQALSEPSFILLMMAAILCLTRHLETGSASSLVSASVFFAVATLTRYAGLAFLGCGAALLLTSERPLRHRLHSTVVLSCICLLVVSLSLCRRVEEGKEEGEAPRDIGRASGLPCQGGEELAPWKSVPPLRRLSKRRFARTSDRCFGERFA